MGQGPRKWSQINQRQLGGPLRVHFRGPWHIWGTEAISRADSFLPWPPLLSTQSDFMVQNGSYRCPSVPHIVLHILCSTHTWGYLLRAVRRLTLRWKLQILSYFYSFQSFQSIFGLYMMKQYVVKLRKLFPQFYTVFFGFDVTPW